MTAQVPVIAIARLQHAMAQGRLIRQDWGDGRSTFCMMSALVPGAQSISDCALAGWPKWLTALCIQIYDSLDEGYYEFALNAAQGCQALTGVENGFDKLDNIFLSKLLDLVLTKYENIKQTKEYYPYMVLAVKAYKDKDKDKIAAENCAEQFGAVFADHEFIESYTYADGFILSLRPYSPTRLVYGECMDILDYSFALTSEDVYPELRDILIQSLEEAVQ